jgi:hypothetical protein
LALNHEAGVDCRYGCFRKRGSHYR